MEPWVLDAVNIGIAIVLVILNGFFVAAEFALVKVRISQIDRLIADKRPFAKTARWLAVRLDGSLSACQLGITMASLGLGWVGEPAFARILEPMFARLGMTSEHLIHGLSFVIAFSLITVLHLIIGEQAPKIFAIRRAATMILWCAAPLKFFYIILYPFLTVVNKLTAWSLRLVGIRGKTEEGGVHTEDELRALVREAHVHGNLTGSEHRLINAVFEFDDMVCRRVMVPRADVVFFDVNWPLSECLLTANRTKHTRYPVCDGSLDDILGVVHIKDFVGLDPNNEGDFNLREIMRPPRKVPENMPISKLLRHFQATHQLLAFVMDEYGMAIGVVTLENVLEEIVGPVDDEFDTSQPEITPSGPGEYIVQGATSIEEVEEALDVRFPDLDVDTMAGAVMSLIEKMPSVGDAVSIEGAEMEVLEVRANRATRIRVRVPKENAED